MKLQSLPRVIMFINGFDKDNKHKVAIFDEVVLKRFLPKKMDSAYREVRQAIPITAYSGGLWMTECLDLKLEQIIRSREGYIPSITLGPGRGRTKCLPSTWCQRRLGRLSSWLSTLFS